MKRIFSICIFVAVAALIAGQSFSSPARCDSKPEKKGILLAAFGTSVPRAAAAFDNIEKKTEAAFPGIPVRWAFTSEIVRNKLAGEGKELKSPAQALADMAAEGFTHVAVQSLHTIAGEEFEELKRTVSLFAHLPGVFQKISLGAPLLGGQEDMEKAANAVIATLPEKRKAEDAVVLMGHGSPHSSDFSYAALMWRLQLLDPNIYVGTVEGFPRISDIVGFLKENNVRKVWLAPFMSVAGDHATNDMAGDENDSWKSVLSDEGFACETVLRGTAEYDEFAEIWIDHIREALETL